MQLNVQSEITSVRDSVTPAKAAELTVEIVSAYVSNNTTAPADVAALISAVAGQLSRIGTEPEPAEVEKFEPAVSVRRSVRPDHLVCLVCGQAQKMLRRHLAVQHELTPAEYRERFGLKTDYPMTAPNYARQRRDVALASGLGGRRSPLVGDVSRGHGRRWLTKASKGDNAGAGVGHAFRLEQIERPLPDTCRLSKAFLRASRPKACYSF
jgi:predicted transcriptional regulator